MIEAYILAICTTAFCVQTFLVYGCNARWWGCVKEGSGWYTNVELAERWSAIITPIGWAFAIWGIIYLWEIALIVYLYLARDDFVDPWQSSWWLWTLANLFQAAWAPLFATEKLLPASIALTGIAASLIALGSRLDGISGVDYVLVSVPVWIHAGWTLAASLVNWNLTIQQHLNGTARSSLLLAAGFATIFLGMAGGVVLLLTVGASALPACVSLVWALLGIRANAAKKAKEGPGKLVQELCLDAAEHASSLVPAQSEDLKPPILPVVPVYAALESSALLAVALLTGTSIAVLVCFFVA